MLKVCCFVSSRGHLAQAVSGLTPDYPAFPLPRRALEISTPRLPCRSFLALGVVSFGGCPSLHTTHLLLDFLYSMLDSLAALAIKNRAVNFV